MPIFIKDFIWTDSTQNVVLSIPLKGIEASKVDIVLTSNYLKVSFPPFIFECFFYKPVSEDATTCVASGGIMQISAAKLEPKSWPQLQIDNVDDKSVTREIREAAIQQFSERQQAASAEARANRRANQQFTLQEQMKLEEADRSRVEAAKQAERDSAMRELEEFRLKQQRLKEEARRVFKAETAAAGADIYEQQLPGGGSTDAGDSKDAGDLAIFQVADSRRTRQKRQSVETVLGVREAGRIGVSFTARVFPTPVRESQKALEDEWLQKQAERRRQADESAKYLGDGTVGEELSAKERDPVWLRDKGNQLFAAGNYLAAINAYSHAIDLKSQMHSLYSNRAACHLKLNNFFKAMEDASKALELLQPAVEQNRTARVRAHSRRAAALCGLGAHAEALVELREAARLAPDSAEIAADLARVEHLTDRDNKNSDDARDGLDDVDD